MGTVRTLFNEYPFLRDSDFFKGYCREESETPSRYIRLARAIETGALAALTAGVSYYLCKTPNSFAISLLNPGFPLGLAAGLSLAFLGHTVRKTVLSNNRFDATAPQPNKISITKFHLDVFSCLRGKWQVLEATSVAAIGIAILFRCIALAKVHPFAMAVFGALTIGTTVTYFVADTFLNHNYRKI